jgi:hypothetical protein
MVKNSRHNRRVPFLLWPFWAIGQLVRTILELTGRLVGVVLGFVFVVLGIVLSLTVIGAILGIPLAGLGVLLIIRGLF